MHMTVKELKAALDKVDDSFYVNVQITNVKAQTATAATPATMLECSVGRKRVYIIGEA